MKVISSRQEGAHRIDYVTLSPDEERLEACRCLNTARSEIYELEEEGWQGSVAAYQSARRFYVGSLNWIEALGVETATNEASK